MRPDLPGFRRGSGHWLTVPISYSGASPIIPKEAFFPEWSAYLGRANRQEPVRQSNVLSVTGDHL